MAKEYAKKFYRSKVWQKCRAAYVQSVFGLCERCESPGKIVHHKEYITPSNINNPDITLNHDNLELLCQDCHNKEHFEKYSPLREGLRFDDDGNLIQINIRENKKCFLNIF
ncbi:HNH endonuclease [Bacillus pseudomycoides]|uniref:HNH endonuclease n=1 Tax=Bacillus pseudomycoides TaxID=64104 RepID=A0AA91VAL4_9BACI|nr:MULTISPECIES: HNH endonuclease [Bacillus]PEB56232.1 HNH endonuclease [Bacillus sp. AFS098217]PED81662.1 HNH endonuclease [Bacillus pseudomycoides]